MGFSSGIEDTDTDILNAINSWYEEKDEYVNNEKDSSGSIKYGHYQLMINPDIQCFGIGSFIAQTFMPMAMCGLSRALKDEKGGYIEYGIGIVVAVLG